MAWIKKRKTSTGEARYDVGYRLLSGQVKHKTFRRERDAKTFLRTTEVDVLQGRWIDPRAGEVTLRAFAEPWLDQRRSSLSPRTHSLYASELRCHILPVLGDEPLRALTPAVIRSWHAKLVSGEKPGAVTAAKVYRLLRTILATAVADELIHRNPCVIKNAGREITVERPMPSAAEMMVLADAVAPRRRLIVTLGGQTGMRKGEILALRRRHVDLLHGCVHIEETAMDLKAEPDATKAPKSEAGRRTLYLGSSLLKEVEAHLANYLAASIDAHLFTGVRGGRLRAATWHQEWSEAKETVGLTGYHFHDLRHLAGTWFAQAGATTKETMRRLGHSTPAAALRYQHATDERDQALAVEHERQMVSALAGTS
jgi:integrase